MLIIIVFIVIVVVILSFCRKEPFFFLSDVLQLLDTASSFDTIIFVD
jgi:hypothetical protein